MNTLFEMTRTRLRRGTCALAWLVAAAGAQAQIGNPAGGMPAPATPAPTNPQDRLFVQLIGMGGHGEVAMSRLADGRARHPEVKAFARRMVADHAGANRRLAEAARSGAVPVPQTPGPDEQAAQARVEGVPAAAFDTNYLQEQRIAHQKTVQLLQWQITNGQNEALKRYAAATLPTVLDHLAEVQRLTAEVTGAAAQGLAEAGDERTPNARR